MDAANEINLIIKSKSGDSKSFETLIKPHMKKCFNIALGYTANVQDAEDISQNAIIKVYNNLKSFKGNSKFSTWVYRIVINECHDFVNSKWSKNTITTIDKNMELLLDKESCDDETESKIIKKETQKNLYTYMDKLDKDKKEVLMLRDIQNLSYLEISNILNISLGTVKSRISRARIEFKSIICSNNELLELLDLTKEVHCG